MRIVFGASGHEKSITEYSNFLDRILKSPTPVNYFLLRSLDHSQVIFCATISFEKIIDHSCKQALR